MTQDLRGFTGVGATGEIRCLQELLQGRPCSDTGKIIKGGGLKKGMKIFEEQGL